MAEGKEEEEEETIAKLDYELFCSFITKVLEGYRDGKVSFSLVGPRVNVGLLTIFRREVLKKFNMRLDDYRELIGALAMTLHHVLSEEAELVVKDLASRNEIAAKELERKFLFIKDSLGQFPELREQYMTQTYCKSFFLKDLSWEANVKSSHSPVEYSSREPPSPFPFGRIRIALATPEYPIEELKSVDFDFEVSYYDVDSMIRTLEDLKSSLLKLRKQVQGEK